MAGKVIFYHGLPGSGKSTARDKYVAEHPDETVIVINRDDLRTQLFGEKYHSKNPDKKSEQQVTAIQGEMFRKALAAGYTVIDDNTNLNTRFMKRTFDEAVKYGAEIEQEYFDIPVEECKRRNKKRGEEGGRFVPPFVIDQMASRAYDDEGHLKRFIYSKHGMSSVSMHTPEAKRFAELNERLAEENPIQGKATVIVDCDGTLANNVHFSEYYLNNPDRAGERDFDSFYRSIKDTQVNEAVRDLANSMRDNDGLNIIVVTGRDNGHPDELVSFIEGSGLKASRIIPKFHGDMRPDYEFKKEVLKDLKKEGLIPVHAIDDRDVSVRMFEGEGIMVSRIYPPKVDLVAGADVPPEALPAPEINTVYGSGFCIRCGSKLKQGNIGKRCAQKANI